MVVGLRRSDLHCGISIRPMSVAGKSGGDNRDEAAPHARFRPESGHHLGSLPPPALSECLGRMPPYLGGTTIIMTPKPIAHTISLLSRSSNAFSISATHAGAAKLPAAVHPDTVLDCLESEIGHTGRQKCRELIAAFLFGRHLPARRNRRHSIRRTAGSLRRV